MKSSELVNGIMYKRKITKEKLAGMLGVSVKTIENWISDKKAPQGRNLSELMSLFDGKDEPQTPDPKDKIIELQDQIISQGRTKDEIMTEIEGKTFKIIKK